MAWRPQLSVVCGRCGQRREGLVHVCRSNSRRKATAKPKLSFGKCPRCKKPYSSNPLAHTCRPKSDFQKRKRQAARKQPEKHDYQACQDRDCPRPLCVAYKTGWKQGYDTGYKDGWQQGYDSGYKAGWKQGYDRGFPDGIAACPRPHQ